MAIITVSDLQNALRAGSSTAETTEITRLRTYAIEVVNKHANSAPDTVKSEAIVRLASYLYDLPPATRGQAYAGAFRNSGAGAVLLPYRVHRAGAVSSNTANEFVGTTSNPVTNVAVSGTTLTVTFQDNTTQDYTVQGNVQGTSLSDWVELCEFDPAPEYSADTAVDRTTFNSSNGIYSTEQEFLTAWLAGNVPSLLILCKLSNNHITYGNAIVIPPSTGITAPRADVISYSNTASTRVGIEGVESGKLQIFMGVDGTTLGNKRFIFYIPKPITGSGSGTDTTARASAQSAHDAANTAATTAASAYNQANTATTTANQALNATTTNAGQIANIPTETQVYNRLKTILETPSGSPVSITNTDANNSVSITSTGSGGGGNAATWAQTGNTSLIPDIKVARKLWIRNTAPPANATVTGWDTNWKVNDIIIFYGSRNISFYTVLLTDHDSDPFTNQVLTAVLRKSFFIPIDAQSWARIGDDSTIPQAKFPVLQSAKIPTIPASKLASNVQSRLLPAPGTTNQGKIASINSSNQWALTDAPSGGGGSAKVFRRVIRYPFKSTDVANTEYEMELSGGHPWASNVAGFFTEMASQNTPVFCQVSILEGSGLTSSPTLGTTMVTHFDMHSGVLSGHTGYALNSGSTDRTMDFLRWEMRAKQKADNSYAAFIKFVAQSSLPTTDLTGKYIVLYAYVDL